MKTARTRRYWTTDGAALFSERRVAWEISLLSTLPFAPSVPELGRSEELKKALPRRW